MIFLLLTLDMMILTILNFEYKDRKWFTPVFLFFGFSITVLWIWLMRYVESKSQLLIYTIIWEVIQVIVGVILPVVIYNIKLSTLSWVAATFMLTGIGLMKVAALLGDN